MRPLATRTIGAERTPARTAAGRVLVTGATGFIGGHLVSRLATAGAPLRLLVRDAARAPSVPGAEIAQGDALDARSMARAMEGIQVVVWLIHAMTGPRAGEFAARDREAARIAAEAADAAGVERIVYLGGLGSGPTLSPHLRSRREVARILGDGPARLTWLRAAVIVGAGGSSWEMMRQLVSRLPAMVTPRWVSSKCQPIALRDVLASLQACLEHPETTGETYDLCGPDVLTYRRMMEILGEEMGRRPVIVEVPVLTPNLSAYWVDLVTDTPRHLAHALIEGLRNDVVCEGPSLEPYLEEPMLGYREATRLALEGKV